MIHAAHREREAAISGKKVVFIMYTTPKIRELTIISPCDLYGQSARNVHSILTSVGGVFWLKKADGNKTSPANSLLSLLTLDVHKGDVLRIACTQKSGGQLLQAFEQDAR